MLSNSTEMSPRKTRRGVKGNGVNESLSENISQKSDVNSPSPSQHSIKTRRQLTKTSSVNSEGEQSLDINKSKKIAAKETSLAKTSKSKKKLVPTTDIIDDSQSAVNVSIRTRKRTRSIKENDVTLEQTSPTDGKTMDEVRADKSQGTRARKKIAKKGDAKSEEDSINITVGEKNKAIVVENCKIIPNEREDARDSTSNEDKKVQEASVRILRVKAGSKTPPSPRSVTKRRGRASKLKIEDFTPESSPMAVNLTPHRTTKTPRKSPMNLGSPKSHEEKSLRQSKTPRKLPVVEESPATSEISHASSIQNTSKDLVKHQNGIEAKSPDKSSSKKKRTPKSSGKKSRKSPSKISPVRRFSKSPKIVLRTPRAKSSKCKSPRVFTSKTKISPVSKRLTKSPTKSSKSLEKSIPKVTTERIVTSSGPKRAKDSKNPEKSTVESSHSEASRQMTLHLSRIDSRNSISVRDARCSNLGKESDVMVDNLSPIIVLNPISSSRNVTPETPMRSSTRTNNTGKTRTTPPKTSSAKKRASQGGESPRRSKSSSKKRGSISDSGTPLGSSSSPQGNASTRPNRKSLIISSSNNTPDDVGRQKLNKTPPIVSSTPHERTRRVLNLSPDATPTIISTPISVTRPVGSSTLIGEARVTRSSRIEDESNPMISNDDTIPLMEDSLLIDDKESSRLNETFEIDEKEMSSAEDKEGKAVDGTYELVEPKTPVLRRKMGKRSIEQVDANVEESATKRTCRVRFACSPPVAENNKPVITARSRSATPGQRIGPRRIISGGKITHAETNGTLRKRSNSMSNVSPMKTPIFDMKRRSKSVSDGNAISASKTAQNASVNRLSKPRLSNSSVKKPDNKTPVAKKAPNFALIHERKFAKMESLVDAKKRVEKRHLTINSQIPTGLSRVNNNTRSKPISPKLTAPSVAVNGVYNRYGFKLRKKDAVTIMSQKQPVRASEKKQNENRKMLKGVRTNRRFELIMKARNINH